LGINGKGFSRPRAAHLALVAVWAAMMVAARLVPTFPMWGVGGNFSLASVVTPLAGVFFGPVYGALSAAVGGLVGSMVAPHTAMLLGPFTFVTGTATAFTAGCIAWGGRFPVRISARGDFVINGGIIVYLLGTALWFSQEIGREAWLFPLVFYGAGFAALVAGSAFAGRLLAGGSRALKFPAVIACAFGGLVGGASVANFFGLALRNTPREVWMGLVLTAPLERLAFSAAAAAVGVPLLLCLPKIGVFLGPQPDPERPGEIAGGGDGEQD